MLPDDRSSIDVEPGAFTAGPWDTRSSVGIQSLYRLKRVCEARDRSSRSSRASDRRPDPWIPVNFQDVRRRWHRCRTCFSSFRQADRTRRLLCGSVVTTRTSAVNPKGVKGVLELEVPAVGFDRGSRERCWKSKLWGRKKATAFPVGLPNARKCNYA